MTEMVDEGKAYEMPQNLMHICDKALMYDEVHQGNVLYMKRMRLSVTMLRRRLQAAEQFLGQAELLFMEKTQELMAKRAELQPALNSNSVTNHTNTQLQGARQPQSYTAQLTGDQMTVNRLDTETQQSTSWSKGKTPVARVEQVRTQSLIEEALMTI